jgi:benzoyl-CoA reductase/2-hydroxyglutaryl-CoA dehydratase subunit BcrC/BadD/HgdB
MEYTNGKLSKLKEKLAEEWNQTQVRRIPVLGDDLDALVNRLECAENFLQSVVRNEAIVEQDRYLQAWDEACGEKIR